MSNKDASIHIYYQLIQRLEKLGYDVSIEMSKGATHFTISWLPDRTDAALNHMLKYIASKRTDIDNYAQQTKSGKHNHNDRDRGSGGDDGESLCTESVASESKQGAYLDESDIMAKLGLSGIDIDMLNHDSGGRIHPTPPVRQKNRRVDTTPVSQVNHQVNTVRSRQNRAGVPFGKLATSVLPDQQSSGSKINISTNDSYLNNYDRLR